MELANFSFSAAKRELEIYLEAKRSKEGPDDDALREALRALPVVSLDEELLKEDPELRKRVQAWQSDPDSHPEMTEAMNEWVAEHLLVPQECDVPEE